ncbi:sigma 54-interacting transcriptional regulator [Congregibacter sp.]|uniref:sigma 54-interacting transcriptional regulator n=1 Tax=Congregibacter sp. TaxID=2744308 RepID=UPI003F6AC0F7
MKNPDGGDKTRSLSTGEELSADFSDDRSTQLDLCLVLAFHPDTSRIGERCIAPRSEGVLTLGRYFPEFAAPDLLDFRGLGDSYLSRQALTIECQNSLWQFKRRAGSSRLRLNGQELQKEVELSEEQLKQGVFLTLAQRVVLHIRLQSQTSYEPVSTPELASLGGVSPAMQALREEAARAAKSPGDVLLIGPTGSGKERIARAIHALSCRSKGPWVAVNMAAMPADLASASFFGARKGAYTGADTDRVGFFKQADGGTLFLDEVGDTPTTLQPMLLRALQEREIQVVGGKTERVDLRVIAAMEQDPDQLQESFRPALRYRLGALEIRLPSLAQRREDIAPLAAGFFEEHAQEAGQPWDVERVETEVAVWARLFEQLLTYDWPGNVRELRHVVAQIINSSGSTLCIPASVRERMAKASASLRDADVRPPEVESEVKESSPGRLLEVSDEAFVAAWRDAQYEVSTIARELGVSRPAIYRRLRSLGECRLAADVPLGELLSALDACRGDLASTAERLAVSRHGLQTRLRASGVRTARLSEMPER